MPDDRFYLQYAVTPADRPDLEIGFVVERVEGGEGLQIAVVLTRRNPTSDWLNDEAYPVVTIATVGLEVSEDEIAAIVRRLEFANQPVERIKLVSLPEGARS